MMQAAFVNMENMFELLEVAQEVKDIDDAPAIDIAHGAIEFRDVHFQYEDE